MANTLKEAIAEKIAITDEHETSERKGFKYWLIIPAAVLAVAAVTGSVFVVRRLRGSIEK